MVRTGEVCKQSLLYCFKRGLKYHLVPITTLNVIFADSYIDMYVWLQNIDPSTGDKDGSQTE